MMNDRSTEVDVRERIIMVKEGGEVQYGYKISDPGTYLTIGIDI